MYFWFLNDTVTSKMLMILHNTRSESLSISEERPEGKEKWLRYTTLKKGHSQLCDWADLDTSFSHFEKSLPQLQIKVHLEVCFIFRSVLLDFQSFTEKPVFECPFAHPMILFWSNLVKNSIFLRLCYMQISYGMICNGACAPADYVPLRRL